MLNMTHFLLLLFLLHNDLLFLTHLFSTLHFQIAGNILLNIFQLLSQDILHVGKRFDYSLKINGKNELLFLWPYVFCYFLNTVDVDPFIGRARHNSM